MTSNDTPLIAFCPRCLCPLNIRRSYPVEFCVQAQPPFQPGIPTTQFPNQQPATDNATHSAPPPTPQEFDTPAPPYQPSSYPQSSGHDRAAPAESRRSSASSSSSLDSAFTDYSINTQFATELQAAQDMHFSQQPFQPSSPPPPAMSSPSTESSLTLSSLPGSSPPMNTLPIPVEPDQFLSTVRRWVVFRGRVPGIYASS